MIFLVDLKFLLDLKMLRGIFLIIVLCNFVKQKIVLNLIRKII